ncbi:MAG: hypothetical protein ABSF83_14705 [Nitrososphaerales archaeon]
MEKKATCDSCHRGATKLKPFGGRGDPLVGDFTGAPLVKTWRPDAAQLSKKERKAYLKKYSRGALDCLED